MQKTFKFIVVMSPAKSHTQLCIDVDYWAKRTTIHLALWTQKEGETMMKMELDFSHNMQPFSSSLLDLILRTYFRSGETKLYPILYTYHTLPR